MKRSSGRPTSSSRLLLVVTSAAVLAGCRRAPAAAAAPDPAQVIATWSGGMIKRSEIEAGYANRLAAEPGATPERRTELLRLTLERRARIELLYREATAEGLPERADIKSVLRAQSDRMLAEDWLQSQVAAKAHASDAQLEGEMAKRTVAPAAETRRFGHIFLRVPAGDAAARASALEKMEGIRQELAGGAAFEELARKYSDSITARGGGQVEWTAKEALHPAAAAVVFAMSEGQVSEVVETEAGLQIFRLDGIRRPQAPDAETLRAELKRTLDAEAGRAAAQAERQRVWDDAGLSAGLRVLGRPGRPDEAVIQVAGEPLTRAMLDQARDAWNVWVAAGDPPPLADLARFLAVNRLLAERRRQLPIEPALQKRLDDATKNVLVDARRRELIGVVPVDVTAAEIAAYYEAHKGAAPFLREHVIDLLFFAQKGDSAAGVYAQGELVGRALRDGRTFDQVLAGQGAHALVARKVPAGDLQALQAQSPRLHKALTALAPGEVSAPVYLEGEKLSFGSKGAPLVGSRGLAFVRLVEIRPVPLAAARDRIREALVREKQSQGVSAAQQSMNARIQLKMLVDRL
jgi:parvulin-like peptidyl-prolyl isomerase